MEKQRCSWCLGNELMIKYHDEEWGVPLHDDKKLFEFFVLDAFQAGLSWQTIINKRENFRKAFHDFNIKKVAEYNEKDFQRLMNDAGIIRNRLKIQGTLVNAKKFLEIQKEFSSFDKYIWSFTNHKTITNSHKSISSLQSKTSLSDKISLDLKEKGFKFVGSTIVYAFMQASGIVNDHLVFCFRYRDLR
ncbi:MAG: DNA-3-methyladenine glycosylase I [Nanoarchaeota archaeon]